MRAVLLSVLLLPAFAHAGPPEGFVDPTEHGFVTPDGESVWEDPNAPAPPWFDGTPRFLRPPSWQAIVNGSTTTGYKNVVALYAEHSSYGGAVFCSGTLIAPKWVVTAAHCVEAMDSDFRGWTLYIIVGGNLYSSSGVEEMVKVSTWASHPSYDPNNLTADIGILGLATSSKQTPAVVNDEAPTTSWYGKELTYVGFGITGDNNDDSGVKRYANIEFNSWDSQFLYSYDVENLCSGDSGGAGFEQTSKGLELAGVNSFVFATDSDPDPSTPCEDGASGATRVDKYISWLEGYTPVTKDWETDTDTDADTDSDSDSDTDADSDTDSDADADTDTDADADADADDTGWDHAQRPPEDVYASNGLLGCNAVPAPATGLLAGLAGLLAFRRRR